MVIHSRWPLAAVALVLLCLIAAPARAAYPEKPVTCMVGFAVGGGTDQVARFLADLMSKDLGQRFVVTNIPGASAAHSVNRTVEGKPDGYTIMLITSNVSVLKALGITQYTYKDMRQIAGVNYDSPGLMVHKDSPYKTLEDFIADAKARPGKINIGVGVPGGMWHLALMRFVKRSGIEVNVVPNTTGGGNVNIRLLGRHVDAAFIPPNEAIAQMRNGDFRMLAITSEKRMAAFPDSPTFKERGIDAVVAAYRGFHMPKGTPDAIVKVLEESIKKAVNSDEYKEFMSSTFSNSIYMTGAEFTKYLEWELADYTKLVEEAGLKKD